MNELKQKDSNPLADIINDEIYITLKNEGLLDRKAIRDYQIQIRFKELKLAQLQTIDAIKILFIEYPDLDFATINKIIYQKEI
ncbi:MAG: hypothetical protein Q8933_08840 [Bacteroidota bacterium]|nr:hypothetical protein [Bacteroidota bacterium]MDP4195350.1 hypothetical protein [Bacteroidota bacterium]